ncbi:SRPBCC family protein [Pseudomonas syringae]|nr:SRPBCC family protein [Pseudomonas syringae]
MTVFTALQPDTRIHNATACRVVSSVQVAADATRAWAVAGDFGGFQAFVPGLEDIEVIGQGPGSVRHKRFKDGHVAVEQLNTRDDQARCMTWTLIYTSLGIGNLWAAMTVTPVDEQSSRVTWTIVADPQADADQDLAVFETFLQGFADTSMNNLRSLFG